MQHSELRNRELGGVSYLDPGFSCQGKLGSFIGLYIQAEVFARKLQSYYRTDTRSQARSKELRVDSILAALKHYKLRFHEQDVYRLFKGGNGTRGEKSARQLRNGYIHSLSVEDRHEIEDNCKYFVSKLRLFLLLRLEET